MAISETSREKLTWLMLESVLIVASILLAFWIDDIASNDLSARQFALTQIQPYLARNGFPGNDCPDGRLVCAE